MKKYIAHVHAKPPHERRLIALQLAGVLTALVFVVWVTTLSVRLIGAGGDVAAAGGSTMSAAAGVYGTVMNQLQVATTTDDGTPIQSGTQNTAQTDPNETVIPSY